MMCFLFGHKPWPWTSTDGVVVRDGWGNPMVYVRMCGRCNRPYLATFLAVGAAPEEVVK